MMTPFDDDLLTALRAARPAAGYQPSAASPEASAMLARIVAERPGPAPRLARRRLLLAGVPAVAAVAAAAVLAAVVTPSGSGSARPGVSAVRTAVLDAFQRDSGDIVYSVRTIQWSKGPLMTQHAWTYPAFAVPGQQVRFRLFVFRGGVPQQDMESIYVQDKASAAPEMPTTQGPRTSEITDVEYTTRTWSRQQTSSVLLAGSLSPSLIRDKLASGGFTVAGTVSLHGRRALELTWSSATGEMTTSSTLWVDDQTYLPLRSVLIMHGRPGGIPFQTVTTEYEILPATPANLNLLTPPIPAGFTRAATSPRLGPADERRPPRHQGAVLPQRSQESDGAHGSGYLWPLRHMLPAAGMALQPCHRLPGAPGSG